MPFDTERRKDEQTVDTGTDRPLVVELCFLVHVIVYMVREQGLGQTVSQTKKHPCGDHVGLIGVGLEEVVVGTEKGHLVEMMLVYFRVKNSALSSCKRQEIRTCHIYVAKLEEPEEIKESVILIFDISNNSISRLLMPKIILRVGRREAARGAWNRLPR